MTPGPDQPIVELTRWDGPWDADDPDANFKHDVALYSRLDPLATIENLSGATGIPIGSLCRYILAKWASAGAEALMAMGPSTVIRMSDMIEAKLGTPTVIANPFVDMSLASKVDADALANDTPALMIACGLAMRSFS